MIRPMRWWDIEPVRALDLELFGAGAWTSAMFWSELAAQGRSYVVWQPDSEVRGYCGLAVLERTADIQTIGVAASQQGKGVGRQLLVHALDLAAAAGAREVLLEVRSDALPAQALYRSLGFSEVGVRRGYYQPEDLDALVMRLAIGEG